MGPTEGLSGAGRAGASSDSLGRPGPVGASESWGPLGEGLPGAGARQCGVFGPRAGRARQLSHVGPTQ